MKKVFAIPIAFAIPIPMQAHSRTRTPTLSQTISQTISYSDVAPSIAVTKTASVSSVREAGVGGDQVPFQPPSVGGVGILHAVLCLRGRPGGPRP